MKRLKRALCVIMAMVMMTGVSTEVSAYEIDCAAGMHDYVTTVIKATPTKEGREETVCARCGHEQWKSTLIAKPTLNFKNNDGDDGIFTYTGKPITLDPFYVGCILWASGADEDDYTVTYKNNKNVGVATITVTFKDTCEYYSGTLTTTFTIVPRAPKNFKMDYKTGKITVKWDKVKEADGYQIQASAKKSFKGAKTYKVKNKNTTKKVIKDVLPAKYPEGGKLYRIYISMRSYKKVKVNGKTKTIYSDWKDKSWFVYKAHLVLK